MNPKLTVELLSDGSVGIVGFDKPACLEWAKQHNRQVVIACTCARDGDLYFDVENTAITKDLLAEMAGWTEGMMQRLPDPPKLMMLPAGVSMDTAQAILRATEPGTIPPELNGDVERFLEHGYAEATVKMPVISLADLVVDPRAHDVLLSMLTPEQRTRYQRIMAADGEAWMRLMPDGGVMLYESRAEHDAADLPAPDHVAE